MRSLLIPTLALDLSLLQRLADSIDYPIDDIVVINNGKPGALDEWQKTNSGYRVIDMGYNTGCSGAWNNAPKVFKNDHWLISNDDQVFQPGALQRIYEAIEQHQDCHVIYVNNYEAFDFFVWTRKAVKDFGLFDENFYPIYYEDWEMRLRFAIGEAKIHMIDEHFPVKHGKEKATSKAYMNMLKACDPINKDYFIRKWNSITDKNAAFKTPFNQGGKISEWTLEKDRRKTLRGLWDEFYEQPKVALYDL